MTLEGAPRPHIVVFDVNVYLDVARLMGEPFTWQRFDELAVKHASSPLPYHDGRVDSLRAIAVTATGHVCPHQPVEVWTSHHIDGLVVTKAMQPTAAPSDELRGLGWARQSAEGLLGELVHDLVFDRTGGGTTGTVAAPWGSPPLSHEDGNVYATLRDAAPDADPEPRRICVTRDGDFLNSSLFSNADVWHPADWVQYVRQSRVADHPGLATMSARTPRPGPPRGLGNPPGPHS